MSSASRWARYLGMRKAGQGSGEARALWTEALVETGLVGDL